MRRVEYACAVGCVGIGVMVECSRSWLSADM